MQKEDGMQAVQKHPGYEAALGAWRRKWLALLVFADVLTAAMCVVACLSDISIHCSQRGGAAGGTLCTSTAAAKRS
jgi:hypothetical protein